VGLFLRLRPAALAERYRIERELGQGGMAEVAAEPELILVQNFFEELKARVPN
jgi:hypothetical protein